MKIAAIQMVAEFADVEANLKIAERLATQAFNEGAEWVILPEFFTSAMAFQEKMLDVAGVIDGEPLQLLKSLAIKHNGVVGGSFIALRDDEFYNTFALVFPNGTTYFHDKDQPSAWENCYYIGGTDDGVLETEAGNIGAVLCWEFMRSRTAKRLLNRVDLVVGGSCWCSAPLGASRKMLKQFTDQIVKIQSENLAKFAKMLGVPVVHAAHAGKFEGDTPFMPNVPYKSFYIGETLIVDGGGKILARLTYEDGEGIIMADIDLAAKWEPSEPIPNTFWIPDMPQSLKTSWEPLNEFGEKYYRTTTKPYKKGLK